MFIRYVQRRKMFIRYAVPDEHFPKARRAHYMLIWRSTTITY
jgi:hypothetical protein